MERIFVLCLISMLISAPALAADKPKDAAAPAAQTETVTTTTESTTTSTNVKTETSVEPDVPAEGSRVVHFEDYDTNHDGTLSREEAGNMLFHLFDTDGNLLIDNIEYNRKTVLTKSPMKKITKKTFSGDGADGHQEVTEEKVAEDTMLSRFDKNGKGLSPKEFTGVSFVHADVNRDRGIDKKEWMGVYTPSIDAQNRADAALNK